MSNRNFDSRVVIQRLRDKNLAQNFAQFQQNGQSIINNPQTSDPSPQRIGQYYDGAGTAVVQNLLGSGYTVNVGATANFTPSIPSVQPTLSAPTITTVIGNHKSLVVEFTQSPVSGITITNYEYSTDGGVTFRGLSPAITTSPILITTESSDGTTELVNGTTYSIQLKAVTANITSTASNAVDGTPTSIGLEEFTTVETRSWTAPTDIYYLEYLVVGGGGGGGNGYDTGGGAGGGGGMVLTGMMPVLPGQSYTLIVGAGGDGGIGNQTTTPPGRSNANGISGENTQFDTIVALGGGSGNGSRLAPLGAGIGGIAQSSSVSAPTGGQGGGNWGTTAGGCGGGGGGAGGNGTNGTGSSNNPIAGGTGGTGISSSISGTPPTSYGAGGDGARGNTNVAPVNALPNTGNGGDAGSNISGNANNGANGGSGIVIIKY